MLKLFSLLGMQAAQRALWYVPLVFYMEKVLGFSGMQISLVIGSSSIASMFAPYLAGWLADRFVPARRLYIGLQWMGAIALLCAYGAPSFGALLALIFIENITFMAGVALSNAICFQQLRNPAAFGRLALGGTIGWFLASWCYSAYIDHAGDSALRAGLLAGGLCQAVLAVYALRLPESFPGSRNAQMDWVHMRELLGKPGLRVLLLAAMACGFAYSFLHLYSQFRLTDAGLGEGAAQRWLTLGQLCEMGALFMLASVHRWIGRKRVVMIGMVALLVRMVVMSMETPMWLLIAVQGLHGIDFAFAAVTIAIAAEQLSTSATRARAQALTMLCLWGFGRMLGFFASGWAWDAFDGPDKWSRFFLMPLLVVALVLPLFAWRFPGRESEPSAALPER